MRLPGVVVVLTFVKSVVCPGPDPYYVPGQPTTSTTSTSPSITSQPNVTDCKDISTGVSLYCWDALDMTDWMFSWNRTTVCELDEPWSTCFMRLSSGIADQDCSTIGSQSCKEPAIATPSGAITEAHVFYGAYNIWGAYGSQYHVEFQS